MLPRRIVVQPFTPRHSLARGGEGARRSEGCEYIQRGQGWNGAARCDATWDDVQESVNQALEYAIGFGDAGGDWYADEICGCEAADGSTGWVDAVNLVSKTCFSKWEACCSRYVGSHSHPIVLSSLLDLR